MTWFSHLLSEANFDMHATVSWFTHLFSEGGFSPHAICLSWDDQVLTWAIIGHAMIALAYAAIPIQLILVVWKLRHDWRLVISSRGWVLALFAAFVASCGIGHALMLLDYFRAFYRLEATWHVWTGLISLLTAFMLPFMMTMEKIETSVPVTPEP